MSTCTMTPRIVLRETSIVHYHRTINNFIPKSLIDSLNWYRILPSLSFCTVIGYDFNASDGHKRCLPKWRDSEGWTSALCIVFIWLATVVKSPTKPWRHQSLFWENLDFLCDQFATAGLAKPTKSLFLLWLLQKTSIKSCALRNGV